MSTLETVATTTTTQPINYASIYYRNPEHDFAGYFNQYTTDEEKMAKIKLEIKRLTDKLAEQTADYAIIMNKRYNADFTPAEVETVFLYKNRNGDKFYFDVENGAPIVLEEDKHYNIVDLGHKTGETEFLVGYALSLGAVIIRRYKYNIPVNNSRMNLTFLHEAMIPVINPQLSIYKNFADGTTSTCPGFGGERWNPYQDTLKKFDAKDFLTKFYGIEAECCNINLNDMAIAYSTHPSMEMLVRQAPKDSLKSLLDLKEEEGSSPKKNLAQYLDLTKPELKTIAEEGLVSHWVEFLKFRQRADNISSAEWEKIKASKTNPEWIDLMIRNKGWEEDFAFYHVTYRNTTPLLYLLERYSGLNFSYYGTPYHNFGKYYTFNEFCNYVVDGVINQGYTRLDEFVTELRDYLNMAETLRVKPNTDTAYLKQTHDLISRNYNIVITEQQEEIFANRYADYKTWVSKDKKFTLIAPKTTEKIKQLGSELNNCLGGYIARIVKGECLIFTLYSTSDLETALVAIEVRNNAMVQVKRSHNRAVTEADEKYLRECCEALKWEYRAH